MNSLGRERFDEPTSAAIPHLYAYHRDPAAPCPRRGGLIQHCKRVIHGTDTAPTYLVGFPVKNTGMRRAANGGGEGTEGHKAAVEIAAEDGRRGPVSVRNPQMTQAAL
ncbi:hypothetical protein GGE12_000707 [Rhizobium mongolense]|uniref:Uncharacterized protein n=1 Tax=Rhizobium mongolense TaxID=57676 RepID=A0A7W6RI96_9HYPH|nr:hypothetical protein [Rhizobium mongolense]